MLVAAALVLTAGCGSVSGSAQPAAEVSGSSAARPSVESATPAGEAPSATVSANVGSPPSAAATPGKAPRCPPTPSGASFASVDYVDFLQANDTEYIADLMGRLAVSTTQIGPVQLRVRCSFSELNAATHRMTPQAENGDAGFLTAGTEVHAITGWSPLCRLAAQRDGKRRVYLAYEETATQATPKPCALRPTATAGTLQQATPSRCAGHGFSLSMSGTGGQPSPLAEAGWFGVNGQVPGVPKSGWRIISQTADAAEAQSGGVVLHLVRGLDETWLVDSGSTCS
jgi:hypothetical protein